MPDPNDPTQPPKNPYAATAYDGPFTGAITPQLLSQPHTSDTQFHGPVGKGGAIAGFLDKFLAGYGQGQAKRAMATEMQKYEYNQGFAAWRNAVLKSADVPDTDLEGKPLKAAFEKETLQAQMKTAAEATEDHKDTPILGALHKVFSGLAGGEVTKSKSDIPVMKQVQADWESKLALPQNTIKGQQTIIAGNAQQLIAAAEAKAKQEGREFTEADARKVIQPLQPKIDQLWGARSKELTDQIVAPFGKKPTPKPQTAEEKAAAADAALEASRKAAPAGQATATPTAPPETRPAAQASPATPSAPPASRTQSPNSDKGGGSSTGAAVPTAPPVSRSFTYTPQENTVINARKLTKPSERVLIEGSKEPVYAQKIEPYVTDNGVGIRGGWRLEDGTVIPQSSANPYKEHAPVRLSAKEEQENVDSEHGWAVAHGVKYENMTDAERSQAHERAKNKPTGELKDLEIAYGVIRNKKNESPERVQASQAFIRDHEMKNLAEITKLNEQKNTQPWSIGPAQPGKAPIDRFDSKQKQIIAKSLNYLTGAVPTLGISGTLRDQVLSGIGAIEEVTGVSPEELNARVTARKSEASALPRLTLLNDSVEGLEKALDRHGKILEELRPKLPSTDVKVLNQWLLSKDTEFDTGQVSKDAVRYALALQAVKSEYARVIASGAASAGQTNVNAAQEAGQLISKGFTSGQTKAMIDQIRTETQQRTAGQREELKEMQNRLAVGIVPELYGRKYSGPHDAPPETRRSTSDPMGILPPKP